MEHTKFDQSQWGRNTGIKPGTYITVQSKMEKGDRIELQFDMRGRIVKQDDYQAIFCVAQLFWRVTTRFSDGFIDETSVIQNENGIM